MAALSQYNRVKVAITAGGTGALTLGSAISGFNPLDGYPAGVDMPYMVEWSTGYEMGYGSYTGASWTRAGIIENNLGTDAFQSIPSSGATLLIGPLAHTSLWTAGSGAPPSPQGYNAVAAGFNAVAIGQGAIAIGSGATAGATAGNCSISIGESATSAGVSSTAIGNAAAASADSSLALMGATDAAATGSISIGSGGTTVSSETCLGFYPNDFHIFRVHCQTTDATPIVAVNSVAAVDIVIPEGQTWNVKTRVLGVAYNTGTLVETKSKLRTFNILASPTGVLVAGTPADELNHATFSGTASVAVSGAGVLSVTVTGIAATTIEWYIHHEVIVGYHDP